MCESITIWIIDRLIIWITDILLNPCNCTNQLNIYFNNFLFLQCSKYHPHSMIHLFILSEFTSYQATSVSAMVVRTGIKNLVLLMTFAAFNIKNSEFTRFKDLVCLKEDSVKSITIAVLLVFNPRHLPFLLLQWLLLKT